MLNKMYFSANVLTTKQVGNYLFVSLDALANTNVTFFDGVVRSVSPVFAINLTTGLPFSGFNTTFIDGKVLDINVTTSGKLVLAGSFTSIGINGTIFNSPFGLIILNISNFASITSDAVTWSINPTAFNSIYKTEVYLDQVWVCGDISIPANRGGGIAQFIESGSTWTGRSTNEISVTSGKLVLGSIAIDQVNGILYTTYGVDQINNFNPTGNGTSFKINVDHSLTRRQFYLPYSYNLMKKLKIWYNNGKIYISGPSFYGATPAMGGFAARNGLSIYTTCASAICAPTQDSTNINLGTWQTPGDPSWTYINDLKFDASNNMYMTGVINSNILNVKSDPFVSGGSYTRYTARYYWRQTNTWHSQTCCPQPWNCYECNFGMDCPANGEGFTTPLAPIDSRTYSSVSNNDIFLYVDSSGNPLSSFSNSTLQYSSTISNQTGATGYENCNPLGYNGTEKINYDSYSFREYYDVISYSIKQGKGNSIFVSGGKVHVFGNFTTNVSCGAIDGFSVGNHLILGADGKKISYTVV
jgi:hypothetical protein